MSFKYRVFSAERIKTPVEVEIRSGKKAQALVDQVAVQLLPVDTNSGGTLRLNFEDDDPLLEKLAPGAVVEVTVTEFVEPEGE